MTLYDEFEKVKGTFQQKVPTSTLGKVQARANYLLQHVKANPDVWTLGLLAFVVGDLSDITEALSELTTEV